MNAVDYLDKALDRITAKMCWTQGTSARDRDGNQVRVDDPKASCWCSSGTLDLNRCTIPFSDEVCDAHQLVRGALNKAAIELWPESDAHTVPYVALNDKFDHAMVMKMWDRARQILLVYDAEQKIRERLNIWEDIS